MTLSAEQKDSKNGVLILSPHQGLSYHLVAALMRLGQRVLGLFQQEADKEKMASMPVDSFIAAYDQKGFYNELADIRVETFVYCAHPFLNLGTVFDSQKLQTQIEVLLEWPLLASLRTFFVLPDSVEQSLVSLIKNRLPNAVIFIMPPLYGFRDEGPFDYFVDLCKQGDPLLLKQIRNNPKIKVNSYVNAAGVLVSALHQSHLSGKVYEMATQEISPEEFRKSFCEAFEFKKGGLHKIASLFSSWPEDLFFLNPRGGPYWSLSGLQAEFPTIYEPMGRTLKSAARILSRDPQSDLHFPPSRAL